MVSSPGLNPFASPSLRRFDENNVDPNGILLTATAHEVYAERAEHITRTRWALAESEIAAVRLGNRSFSRLCWQSPLRVSRPAAFLCHRASTSILPDRGCFFGVTLLRKKRTY